MYIVILDFINNRTSEGKYCIRNGVRVMSGKRFLQYVFKGGQDKIIRYLRRAIRTHVLLNYMVKLNHITLIFSNHMEMSLYSFH